MRVGGLQLLRRSHHGESHPTGEGRTCRRHECKFLWLNQRYRREQNGRQRKGSKKCHCARSPRREMKFCSAPKKPFLLPGEERSRRRLSYSLLSLFSLTSSLPFFSLAESFLYTTSSQRAVLPFAVCERVTVQRASLQERYVSSQTMFRPNFLLGRDLHMFASVGCTITCID